MAVKVESIIMWVIVGLMVVLIVTHPAGFAGDVTTVGTLGYKESQLLTGQGQTGGVAGSISGPGYSVSYP